MSVSRNIPEHLVHARWRVTILRSLLSIHRAHPRRWDIPWLQQEADYARRLQRAEATVASLTAAIGEGDRASDSNSDP